MWGGRSAAPPHAWPSASAAILSPRRRPARPGSPLRAPGRPPLLPVRPAPHPGAPRLPLAATLAQPPFFPCLGGWSGKEGGREAWAGRDLVSDGRAGQSPPDRRAAAAGAAPGPCWLAQAGEGGLRGPLVRGARPGRAGLCEAVAPWVSEGLGG